MFLGVNTIYHIDYSDYNIENHNIVDINNSGIIFNVKTKMKGNWMKPNDS